MVDSIERMRRINDLTRELKQHGFAESSLEAIQQANQIYGTETVDHDVQHGIIKNSMHDKLGVEQEIMDADSEFNTRKLSKVADNVQVLTDKMNEMIRAINDLDARISDIKQKQDRMAAMPQQRPEPRIEPREVKAEASVEERPQASEKVQPQEHAPAAPVKDEYSMNQRTGNFQSQDVAIDKMFYFGNKK